MTYHANPVAAFHETCGCCCKCELTTHVTFLDAFHYDPAVEVDGPGSVPIDIPGYCPEECTERTGYSAGIQIESSGSREHYHARNPSCPDFVVIAPIEHDGFFFVQTTITFTCDGAETAVLFLQPTASMAWPECGGATCGMHIELLYRTRRGCCPEEASAAFLDFPSFECPDDPSPCMPDCGAAYPGEVSNQRWTTFVAEFKEQSDAFTCDYERDMERDECECESGPILWENSWDAYHRCESCPPDSCPCRVHAIWRVLDRGFYAFMRINLQGMGDIRLYASVELFTSYGHKITSEGGAGDCVIDPPYVVDIWQCGYFVCPPALPQPWWERRDTGCSFWGSETPCSCVEAGCNMWSGERIITQAEHGLDPIDICLAVQWVRDNGPFLITGTSSQQAYFGFV